MSNAAFTLRKPAPRAFYSRILKIMFVGHLAAALAAKRIAPTVATAWLATASLLPDLLWPLFLLTGIEEVRIVPGATAFTPLEFVSYPWSHSLLAALVWGFALAFAVARRNMLAVAALTVSHWALDVASHAADLPLWPGSVRLGWGLWNSAPATFAVEGTLWTAAVIWYWRRFRPRPWVFSSLVTLVTVIWIAQPFGSPPPDVKSLAFINLSLALIPPWIAAAERDLHDRN